MADSAWLPSTIDGRVREGRAARIRVAANPVIDQQRGLPGRNREGSGGWNMVGYKRTEMSYALLVGLAIALLALLASGIQQESRGYRLETNVPFLIGCSLLSLCAALVGTLTTDVDEEWLTLRLGPGWVRTSLRVAEITSCRITKNRWHSFWGVRSVPLALLCGLYGLHALEITLSDGRTLLLGTNQPVRLLHAIAAVSMPLTMRARLPAQEPR